MARTLVLTVIGPDRPGLVEELAQLIAAHAGSWDESRMARLAGHFAGVVQIHLPDERAAGLVEALPGLSTRGSPPASSTARRPTDPTTPAPPSGSSSWARIARGSCATSPTPSPLSA